MRFEQYQELKENALALCFSSGADIQDAGNLNAILLAYIGDAVYSLYVRLRLLPSSGQIRVIHDLSAQMVSAVCQSAVMQQLEPLLTGEEHAVFLRGRNSKSLVPKSASVQEYRLATAFEALIGWLFLLDRQERLEEILKKAFTISSAQLHK